jgi:class 3 adenylate cyclase
MQETPVRITREELVGRAGVDAALAQRLIALGIVVPDADGRFDGADVYRVRLVRTCERAGIGAEAIASAIEDGHLSLAFLDLPQYRWDALQTETYGELADRLGLAFDVMREVGAAFGPRAPSASDRVREGDEGMFRLISLTAPLVDTDALARIARVYVDGLRRIAEAEAVLFDTYIVGGLERKGLSYGAAVEQASALGTDMLPLMEQMILALYRRQRERGWTDGIVEGIERVVDEMGRYPRPERPPAFAFIDLAGYTQMTDEQGDQAGADLAAEMVRMVHQGTADHDGIPVKWLGDGVMIRFRDPGTAVRATLEIVERAPAVGLPAHAGIAAGPVVMQDGDYFGRTVNLAARIASMAGAGQTLVSGLVAELARADGFVFLQVGPVELKGFAEPVPVLEALANDGTEA